MKHYVEEQIKEFVTNNFFLDDSGDGLGDTDSFIEKGIIDSTGVLELVSFIEETFEVRVEDEELIPENLDTIADVGAFVLRKRDELAAKEVE